MSSPTHLIVGLGNPGNEYRGTRHNCGFMALDEVSRLTGIELASARFKAKLGNGRHQGRPLVLLKPRTYMNRSGDAVGPCLRYYKIEPANLIVILDDLDLPPGRLRIRSGGGDGGHRGLHSIIESLSTPDFIRLRIGIGHPPPELDPADYVLRPFPPPERELIAPMFETAALAALAIVTDGLTPAMNKYNPK
jgi:peptidyl-tRNA hydrolase, PTH1 family